MGEQRKTKNEFLGLQSVAKQTFSTAPLPASADLSPAGASDLVRHREESTSGSASAANAAFAASLPRWQRERMRRLHRIFVAAEGRIDGGERLTHAFNHFAWWVRRKPRFYRCEPSRPFRFFSQKTLIRLWYLWNGGKNPEALVLKYRSPIKITRRQARNFAMACTLPGVKRLKDAFRRMGNRVATIAGYRRAMPGEVLREVTRLHRWRRFCALQEKKTARAIRRWKR